jgi:hypothetical protein
LVSHSLSGDFNDTDVVAAPKLMEVVLAHCPGAVDRWVDPYVSLAWQRLQRTSRRPLKDQLVVLVAVALHYNAGLTLAALHRLGATQQLLGGWSDLITARRPSGRKPAHFRQQRLKKLCVLGLVALLHAPDDALAGPLAGGLPQVLRCAVTVLNDLRAQQEEAAQELAEGSGGDDEVGFWGPRDGGRGTGGATGAPGTSQACSCCRIEAGVGILIFPAKRSNPTAQPRGGQPAATIAHPRGPQSMSPLNPCLPAPPPLPPRPPSTPGRLFPKG